MQEDTNTEGCAFTIKDLLTARVHYGHKKRFCHADMMPYIYSINNDMAFIDLQATHRLLQNACRFLENKIKQGGEVLFVGTKYIRKYKYVDLIKLYAEKCNMHYVNRRWLGGTLTNFPVVRKSCESLEHLRYQIDNGFVPKLKKEQVLQKRNLERLEYRLEGLVNMTKLPSVIVVIDRKYDDVAIREAAILNIPVIAVVDTNCSLSNVQYPIPGNDDCLSAVEFYLSTLTDVIIANTNTQQIT